MGKPVCSVGNTAVCMGGGDCGNYTVRRLLGRGSEMLRCASGCLGFFACCGK